MKHIKLFLFLTCSFSLFLSCKKKELPVDTNENEPQFYFNGIVNGSPVEINAGVDNYYMTSSYELSSNNLYKFSAELKQANCSNCPNSISIDINDYKLATASGYSGADSAFSFQFYPYYSGNPTPNKYSVTFYSLFNNMPQNYSWSFGDGTYSTLTSPTHIYNAAGEYNVALTVQDTSGCSNTITNTEKIGNMGNACKTTISSSSTSTLTATFTHSTIGMPPYNFYWDFGDGATSTAPIPSHNYSAIGRYPVSLRVIDAKNDTAIARINYLTPNASTCTTNYLITGIYDLPNPNGFSNIVINWTDESGNVYTSNNGAQPSSSYFKIISAENYHENESGQKTKKLTIEFNCMVYNPVGAFAIENGKAVVVVAYK